MADSASIRELLRGAPARHNLLPIRILYRQYTAARMSCEDAPLSIVMLDIVMGWHQGAVHTLATKENQSGTEQERLP